jgi:hypothetical protein
MTWPLVDVIVIDTMASVSPGGNENSAEDVGKLLQHCKFLHKQTGALVVLISHSGKDQTRGMRGWSGAKAAADAEIEVTRNGDYRTLTVTKLKDLADNESFSFKLKVIPLGLNADGEEESSCVIEHVDSAPGAANGKQRPSGAHQVALLDMLKIMAPSGSVNYEDLVAGYAKKMPPSEGPRDRRKRDAQRALDGLIAKKLAFMQGEDRVSLTSLVVAGDDGWLA